MKRKLLVNLALLVGLTLHAQQFPYQNPNLSAEVRAKDLLSRLTLEEKTMLMLDESPAIPRLGIKKFFWWSEALHGAANMSGVTVFPEPIAMASSFNNSLLFDVFNATSDEFRAQYNRRMLNGGEDEKFHSISVWTPNVNIFRDPRWGRGQETYGEDPYLTSVMGTAVVKGLQGPESERYRKLWACAKHYAVHSGPEYTRHTANINDVTPRDFWETYMPAFKTLVQEAKVREVMCAYQRLDDDPCCSNNRLLQQILRDEWGFKYLVVSDCGAVTDIHTTHKTSSTAAHATAKALLAGTDVECGFNYTYKSIPEAVSKGLVSEQEVDKHVLRLLEGRFDLGEMDDPKLVKWSQIPASVLDSKPHRELALNMARQSLVLLQNKNNVLPLKRNGERIAVIGPNADNEPMMWGNYNGTPTRTVSILKGIQAATSKVKYIKGCDLTDTNVMTSLLPECSINGQRGLKGTFWNNTEMEGKPVTTQYYTNPIAVTTAGMHNFAPNVKIEDFSAKYETVFTPRESGKVVLTVEGTGSFKVLVNGAEKQSKRSWRTTPTRTVLDVKAGERYNIEIDYQFVKTWGANLKINLGTESPINYQTVIDQLQGIQKVIFVGGISPALEGEEMPVNIDGFKGGDRTNIELPQVQRDFLKALHNAGKTVVYVNCSGSAIALEPETQTCDAILQTWYAGQEGGTAVADVLFGKVNPSGKLPVTFYKNTAQLPDYESYSMKGRTYRYFSDPLFAFGYGLSYTTYQYGRASVDIAGRKVNLHIPLQNTGKKAGEEIVEIYIKKTNDADGPLKSLRAFKRVALNPGQSAEVNITLDENSFEFFDPETNTMRVVPGDYEIFYGSSSQDNDLQTLKVTLN